MTSVAVRLARILPELEVRSNELYWAYPSVRAFSDFVLPELLKIEGIVADARA